MIVVKTYLEQLTNDMTEIIQFVKSELADMEDDGLFYKSSADEWSVIECLKHINMTNRHYIETMEQKIEQAIAKGSKPVVSYRSGWLGKMSINAMTPTKQREIKSKMKTLKRFRPVVNVGKDKAAIFEEFFDLSTRLLKQIEKANSVDVSRIKIVSAIGIFLMFKLGDALGFVVGHTQRHILQIKNILAANMEATQG